MSEMKGAVFSVAIFIGFVIPFFLLIGIGSIHQHAFMKLTTEVAEIVKDEGGVTDKVNDVVNGLDERGYTISFRNTDGSTIEGQQDYGETIIIEYEYKYDNVKGEETLNTHNVVVVSRR